MGSCFRLARSRLWDSLTRLRILSRLASRYLLFRSLSRTKCQSQLSTSRVNQNSQDVFSHLLQGQRGTGEHE